MESRSLESITLADLKRLGEVATHDRKDFFERRPDRNFLEERVFAVALCQGAAKHYIDGENGIKDFDVWSFFIKVDEINFPVKRVVNYDFGDAKFGQSDDRAETKFATLRHVGCSLQCRVQQRGWQNREVHPPCTQHAAHGAQIIDKVHPVVVGQLLYQRIVFITPAIAAHQGAA